jgi:cobalamin biosynthesis Mg chelatase CobN
VIRAPKRIAGAVLLAAVLLLAAAAPASADTPCWKRLLTDWYDGTIDKTYPIPCYREAVDRLPTDVELYSSAKDDILRAMASAVAAQNPATTEATPTTTQAATTTTAGTVPTETAATTTNAAVAPPATTTTPSPGREKPKGIARALDKLNPSDADSFPLPLLILGALAILLVAAGVIGMIWRRMDRGGPDIDAGAGPV